MWLHTHAQSPYSVLLHQRIYQTRTLVSSNVGLEYRENKMAAPKDVMTINSPIDNNLDSLIGPGRLFQ